MEWPEEYGMEKMLPLVSLYDITKLAGNQSREMIGSYLQPCRYAGRETRMYLMSECASIICSIQEQLYDTTPP